MLARYSPVICLCTLDASEAKENKGLVVVSVATNIYTLPNINKKRKGFHSRSINNFQKRASIQTEKALLCRAILKILAAMADAPRFKMRDKNIYLRSISAHGV
jgi:hypothetical protein